MWLSDVAVQRPVSSVVLGILLCVFGMVSFSKLAVREMPNIETPVVSISTRYEGASATIIESQITSVLEDQLAGLTGVDEITSTTRNSFSRITVSFKLGYDFQAGVSDVRDAVTRALNALPEEASEPVVYKNNGSGKASLYVNLSSANMDRAQLTDYINRVLLDRFNLLAGVSAVNVVGGLSKVMYIELNPAQMAGRGITTQDISQALRRENIERPSGEIRNDAVVMSVRTLRAYQTAQDFQSLVVKQEGNRPAVYLRDIAEVYIGAENESSMFKSSGVVNVSMAIVPQTGANPLYVAKAVRGQVDSMQAFLPEGTRLAIDYDSTVFIERSIHEVYRTLFITAALVVVILYLFIGQVRSTLLPAIAVPASLLSACMAAYYFGYSINLITLMALILAIGLVVDDAIVVVENIYHHIERGETPLIAAFLGTREVGFAVIATTLVLVAVFLPIAFVDDMAGLLFSEFAVLLSMAVVFSSLIALTLTPALASKLLRAHREPHGLQRLVNQAFSFVERHYRRILSRALKLIWLGPSCIVLCIAGSYVLFGKVPLQLTPTEDRGVVFAFVRGAEATSFNRMAANMALVEQRLLPLVEKGVLKSFNLQSPAFGGNAGDQTGFVIMILEDWQQRDLSANNVLAQVRQALKGIPDVRVYPFLPGFRGWSSEPVQFVLGGADYQALKLWAETLKQAAEESPIMEGAELNYSEKTPELMVSVDKHRAAQFGIPATEIADTLEIMLAGKRDTTFVERGEEYNVYLRAGEQHFLHSGDLSKIYLRTSSGELISLASLVKVDEVASSIKLSHHNKKKSITISANLSQGHGLGDALAFLDELAIEKLPSDISVSYSGESKQFKESQSSIVLVFGLALLVAYLVLCAQFESFINPLIIMLTVPMGIVGGLFGLVLLQQGLNIYSQIGMIMLIGMVTKNGILIVEFANQLRNRSVEFETAIIDASVRRLRPIIMTAMTTLAGAIPLLLASGAGYESRMAVGTVIFFGMAFATLVTLFVVPMMYRLVAASTQPPGHVAKELSSQLKEKER
ncbi:multidrug efflux RND transporter permease subunit [Vibrio profundum]|uniref:multidrug efflux RND transporter permease subunit n=1 Tax=Vibrio profundum TaxID=2910247 RepID=UPI003D09FAC1